MFQEPRTDPNANVRAVLTGLTPAQTDNLRGPANLRPNDAEALTELNLLSGIAQRAITELRQGKPLNGDDSPDDLCQHLLAIVRKMKELTTDPHLTGQQARQTLARWAAPKAEGADAWAAFADLRKRLITQLTARDAEQLAQQAAPSGQRRAPAPQAPRTNQEILRDEMARALRTAAPGGEAPEVRALLVLGGQTYRGRNDGRGLLDVTYDLVTGRVDRLEDWTVAGCAEVHALDTFIHAQGFATEDPAYQAFTRAPVAFPDGWIAAMDARGRETRSWTKRAPCQNCQQWLRALNITADTKGNRS